MKTVELKYSETIAIDKRLGLDIADAVTVTVQIINANLFLLKDKIKEGKLRLPHGTEQYWHFNLPNNPEVYSLIADHKKFGHVELGLTSWTLLREAFVRLGMPDSELEVYGPNNLNSFILELRPEPPASIDDGQHRHGG